MLYINKICVLAVFCDDIFVKIFAKKFGGKEKMSTFAIPNEKRGFEKTEKQKKLLKNKKKFWRFEKNVYLCNPKRKTGCYGAQVWQEKFIEKTEEKYKKQVPRKIQFIEKR